MIPPQTAHILKTYDYLAQARARILDWTRPLTPAQYTQKFIVGMGSLSRTLAHVMSSEWYYIERMQKREVPSHKDWPINDENPPPFPSLESAWQTQAIITRKALQNIQDWNAPIEYLITDDTDKPWIITASALDIFTQLSFHEIHHRAQAMSMLRQLGIAAEDIDYNALMYKRRDP